MAGKSTLRTTAPELTIGALSLRTGLAASAIRYYEDIGLLSARRAASGHRRYARSEIRRLSLVRLLQRFGFTLARIGEVLERLPKDRPPREADWQRIARDLRSDLDERIRVLEELRDDLDGCIGCGCLSLKRCALFNPGDVAAEKGAGPRWLMGDRPD